LNRLTLFSKYTFAPNFYFIIIEREMRNIGKLEEYHKCNRSYRQFLYLYNVTRNKCCVKGLFQRLSTFLLKMALEEIQLTWSEIYENIVDVTVKVDTKHCYKK